MFVSCGKQKAEWKGTIEEKNGVTVVKNPKEPIYGEDVFSLEEELSIGKAEGREEYMFSEIESIAVDNEGRIYVFDYKEKNVKIFDKSGEFIKTFGRKGQGPGEFNIPFNMIITSQNEIMVKDMRRLSFFSLEGEFKRSLSTPHVNLTSVDIDSKGNIAGLVIIREEENPRYELKKFDS
ncbi:unnamed protein product, partial [marine sediment metagenome]